MQNIEKRGLKTDVSRNLLYSRKQKEEQESSQIITNTLYANNNNFYSYSNHGPYITRDSN